MLGITPCLTLSGSWMLDSAVALARQIPQLMKTATNSRVHAKDKPRSSHMRELAGRRNWIACARYRKAVQFNLEE